MERPILFLEYFLVLLSVSGISIGQILLKAGALRTAESGNWKDFALAAINLQVVIGIFILGCSTILWIYLLRTIPLSIAYPFMALAFLIVPALSHFTLGEAFTGWRLIGAILIISGVVISSR